MLHFFLILEYKLKLLQTINQFGLNTKHGDQLVKSKLYTKGQNLAWNSTVPNKMLLCIQHCKLTLLIFQQCTYSQLLQLVRRWVCFLECNGSCVPPLNGILQFQCYPGGNYGRLPASMKELIRLVTLQDL